MEIHCLVVSGLWRCSDSGDWDFVIDKEQLARMIPLKEGFVMSDLKEAVLEEFSLGGENWNVSFSYWVAKPMPLGLKPPPVLLTSDGALDYFYRNLSANPSLNLFVTFALDGKKCCGASVDDVASFGEDIPRGTLADHLQSHKTSTVPNKRRDVYEDGDSPHGTVAEDLEACKTPNVPHKRRSVNEDRDSSFKYFPRTTLVDALEAYNTPNVPHERRSFFENGDSSGDIWRDDLFGDTPKKRSFTADMSKTKSDWIDDEVLIAHVVAVEDNLRNVEKGKASEVISDSESESCEFYDVGDVDVRPGGYDNEFWGPLIGDVYGGSNAVEILCSTNDAFDHRVVVNGSSSDTKRQHTGANVNMYFRDTTGGQVRMDRNPNMGLQDNPGGQVRMVNNNADGRLLEDVDDDEFDIPPLFDDVQYVRGDIPDLDRDDEDDGVYVGKLYQNKEDCQIALAIYAIKEKFYFKQTRTKKNYFVLNCADVRCDWRVMAKEMVDTGYYKIKKATLRHTCDSDTRNGFKKKATNHVLAAVYKAKFNDPVSGPRPMDLQQMVLEDLRVSASYMKCWRVKQKAIVGIRGTEEDQYQQLPKYLRLLKATNSGTVADLETELDEEGRERFLYLFLAFGASIKGFSKLRLLLVLDGTHLNGMYKGVLLTASGQDANFQVFPLVFAVVDSENDESWTWFMQKIERIIADSPHLTLISDRHNSIYTAKSRVFPKAHHGVCLVHLQRNVNSKFKSQGLVKLVGQAACAFRVGSFQEFFREIKSRSSECAKLLEKVGIANWSRAYFRGERYNLMTSNIAETLNNALSGGRSCPILDLLMFIRTMMTRWFNARRKKSLNHQKDVPPEVDKQLQLNMKHGKGSKLNSVSSWSVEVVGYLGRGKHHVQLQEKRCSCRVYDRTRLPCCHALLAADSKGLDYATCVYDCHKTKTWQDTYLGVVNPEADPLNEEPRDEDVERLILPPRTRRPPGRPPTNRIPSTGEFPKEKSWKASNNRCGRCHMAGHNRSTCKNPI